MISETDVILRGVYLHARKAQIMGESLEQYVLELQAIVGDENYSIVDYHLSKSQDLKNDIK